MTQNFKTVLEKTELETTQNVETIKGQENKLVKTTSISLDESKLFFSIELKIFKEMKLDYVTGEEDRPVYNTFSVDRTFTNNYLGLEELEKIEAQFNTEKDVRDYLNI